MLYSDEWDPDIGPPSVGITDLEASLCQLRDALAPIVELIRQTYAAISEVFSLEQAATDPMRLSNDWTARAYWAWNWDTVSDLDVWEPSGL